MMISSNDSILIDTYQLATRMGFSLCRMTNLIGQVEAFQSGIDDWEQYTERLEQYFVANKVVDEAQQLAVFITVVGSKTYALLAVSAREAGRQELQGAERRAKGSSETEATDYR